MSIFVGMLAKVVAKLNAEVFELFYDWITDGVWVSLGLPLGSCHRSSFFDVIEQSLVLYVVLVTRDDVLRA